MKDTQLEKMTTKELRALRDQVDQAMVVVEAREKSELRAKLVAMAAEHGLTPPIALVPAASLVS